MQEKVCVKERTQSSMIVGVGGVLLFAALMVTGAYIRFPLPFSPVPVTLQTFFVMLSGAVLGRRLGILSQAAYLLFGIFGLSVFTAGAGAINLFGPTGGYLIGFMLASYAIGLLINDRQLSFMQITAVMLAGEVILFSAGVLWLAFLLKLSLPAALAMGLLPFIPGEVIKLGAAATIYQQLQGFCRDNFSNK